MKIMLNIRNEVFREKNYSLIVLLLIYAFLCGSNISIAISAGLSVSEYIMFLLSDHYYLVYGFFFYGLYWIFKDVRQDLNLEMIRYESYQRYYCFRNAVAFIKIGLYVAIHAVVAAIIGFVFIGFKFGFTGYEIEGYYNSTLETVLIIRKYFTTPWSAILAVMVFLTLGLFYMYELLFYIHKIRGDIAEIITMMIIIVNVMIGFKSQIDESILQLFFLNNYFILHHGLFSCGKVVVIINVIIMISVSYTLNHIAVKENGIKRI